VSAAGFIARPTDLPGCVELQLPRSADARGSFIKLFHRDAMASMGLGADFAEVFCTTSQRGVLRGLHLQMPPHAHAKLVVCLEGAVQDVALDLRRDSATYGRHAQLALTAEAGNALYLPVGCAHGFCVLSASATVLYLTSTTHAPESDVGIAWDSAGIAWSVTAPILSERDRHHPALADFVSPFRMEAAR
jgi:dTDP-4-dehydrorhamnose 3,5-epimerase